MSTGIYGANSAGTIGGAVVYGVSAGSVSTSNISNGTAIQGNGISYSASYNSTDGYAIKRKRTQTPDLPAMTIATWDENDKDVIMTLKPEGGISAADSLKIFSMLIVVMSDPDSFNALAYVKKHNLERHFSYS